MDSQLKEVEINVKVSIPADKIEQFVESMKFMQCMEQRDINASISDVQYTLKIKSFTELKREANFKITLRVPERFALDRITAIASLIMDEIMLDVKYLTTKYNKNNDPLPADEQTYVKEHDMCKTTVIYQDSMKRLDSIVDTIFHKKHWSSPK